MLKRVIVIITILTAMSFSFADVIPLEQDEANHCVVGAVGTKLVYAVTKDEAQTFWIMTGIFMGKEILDLNKTGFSLRDLAFDYLGYGIVKFKFEF
jgi:hypothetical protein